MIRLLRRIAGGESLRHRPVALRPAEQQPVRAFVRSTAGQRDVTAQLFPISLSPLLLGLARSTEAPPAGAVDIGFRDAVSGEWLGLLELVPAGQIMLDGRTLDLLHPTASRVSCASPATLLWRYGLAWRQNQLNARRPHSFRMSLPDLKALNLFYMMPRPVHLVSVLHKRAGNIFPMDLVGPLGDDLFLLALRLTSPSIEPICAGGRIVVSGAPAAMKEAAYQLGLHHKAPMVDWDGLPIQVAPSPLFGVPAPVAALGLRELEVRHFQPVGSHMLFVTSVAGFSHRREEAQFCHVSDMYARWRTAQGRPFTDA